MTESWIRAIVLVCTFGAVLLAAETLASWLGRNRAAGKAINQRLQLIGEGRTRGEALTLLRRASSADLDALPGPVARLGGKLEKLLIAAQVTQSLGRATAFLVGAPLLIFLVLAALTATLTGALSFGKTIMLVSVAVVAGVALPLLVLQFRANRKRRKMQEQFPVALDVFVRGLRAGHPIAAALDLLTVEMPDPVGSEFGIVVDEVTYGADLRDALQAMADRWDMDDIRMFVVSLSVQSETGGNLAEILENLSKVIRERASMMMKVRALSSEGRMTAIMLTVLPIAAFLMMFIMSPGFYLDVADDPVFLPSFAILILMYLFGIYVIRRMVNLKV